MSFPAFYPIIDRSLCASRGLAPDALAAGCLRGGARLLQIRWKDAPSRDFLSIVQTIVALAQPYGGRIIVNDRVDIALMAQAGGVHVGQDDLPPREARRILGPARIVGVSTHDARQLDAALASEADYVAVGPVYGTATKETGYGARGLEFVRTAAGRGKPIVAIGGITVERAGDVIAAGAAAVAVISDLLVGDPEERTREFLRAVARPV